MTNKSLQDEMVEAVSVYVARGDRINATQADKESARELKPDIIDYKHGLSFYEWHSLPKRLRGIIIRRSKGAYYCPQNTGYIKALITASRYLHRKECNDQ